MEAPQACGICFDDLTTFDMENPVLCPTWNCNFNMCKRCISHLVESSKGDFEMASDGNMHVKVKLQCPSCRGDFSSSIEDTLLIRTAIEIYQHYKDIPDTELSSSALRTKYKYTSSFIEDIRIRLSKNRPVEANHSVADSTRKDPRQHGTILQPLFFPNTRIPIDKALFAGLDSVMTLEEQLYLTQFMISGDTHQLAQAAQILHGIAEVVRQGYLSKTHLEDHLPSSSLNHPQIIGTTTAALTEPEMRALEMSFTGSQAEHVKLENRITKHFALHPLPHFMPLYVSMDADFNVYAKHRKLLKFQDDEWDGSIADGFARAMYSRYTNLDDSLDEETNESIELSHYEEEVKEDHDEDNVNESMEETIVMKKDDRIPNHEVEREGKSSRPSKVSGGTSSTSTRATRVLIRQARGKAAAMGISGGMVVSYFNGEEFHGTAEDLKQSLYKLYLSGEGNQSFTMVLNADPFTAEALKLRGSFNK